MFEINFDDVQPAEVVLTKALVKEHIVAYSKRYFEWLREATKPAKAKAEKLATSIKALNKLVKCDACNGSGWYVGVKYTRTCLRCKGNGEYDPEKQAAYEESRKLPSHKTWRDYDNPDWSFVA